MVRDYTRLLQASFFALILFIATPQTQAQTYKVEFGKNRIQYKYFDWNYYASENFEVYFYNGGRNLAYKTIEYLEEEFSRITETIGYPPFAKIRVFLYNSVVDKQQSNVGVNAGDFTVGGQTDFVQSQVELAYSGDYTSFKEKVIYSITEMLIEEMLYGGNIAEMFQSSFTNPIPLWFTGGIARYVSVGWDSKSDDGVREYVSTTIEDSFVKLTPEMNILLGQSIWNFIAQKYGQRSISNILNLARIIRNEENSIERTLGVPFDQFMKEWRVFYSNTNVELRKSYKLPNEANRVSGKNRNGMSFTDVKFSPDGKFLAYSRMSQGQFSVKVLNMANNDEREIFNGGLKLNDQEVDMEYPLLSWADSTTLGIVYAEDGRNIVAVKRLGTKGEQKIEIPLLSKIQSFDFKDGGRFAVMTGAINDVPNAFTYNLVRGQVRKISDDYYDERDITFYPGSNQIVFISNRKTDSVFVDGPQTLKEVEGNQFNLYAYDIDYPDSSFKKLTNALAVAKRPKVVDGNFVLYLSDQQGINNIYKFNGYDSTSVQITDFLYGIKAYDYHPESRMLAFVSSQNGEESVFLKTIDIGSSMFSPVTPRRALEVARILAERRRSRIGKQYNQLDSISNPEKLPTFTRSPLQKLDSLKEGAINTEAYEFEAQTKVDTRDYRFEKPSEDPNVSGRSFLSIYQNANAGNTIQGPTNYENRFQTNNVVTTFVIDELRSFSQLLEIEMNDYLQNHRFKGGVLIPLSFSSGYDVYGEYEYLKNRIDLSAGYYRKSIVRMNASNFLNQRFNKSTFNIGLSYPFTHKLRLEFNPFFTQTKYIDRDIRLLIPSNNPAQYVSEITSDYLGFNSSLVFDNTIVTGTNLHQGTRAKIRYETHLKMNQNAVSFSNLEVDVRHYYKLNRAIYLAGRAYFGSYYGNAPKKYLLGGVDNWAFNTIESSNAEINPLEFQTLFDNSDVLFHQFTNLRGYNYNTFQGRNVMTFSGELRFPINQLMSNSDLKSNFLRNLQFVAFYDIGSAWDDLSPFKKKNNLNIEEIRNDNSPFSAVINNFSNPWLQSTGVGVRTMLFGFFSRIDFSFPIRNFETLDPKLQLSFGYDF
jgi:Tol biopolymer transport system component